MRFDFRTVFLAVIAATWSAPAEAQETPEPFTDCDGCPEMVVVNGGAMTLGSELWEADAKAGEGRTREVTIAYDFAVSRHEITKGQYRAFVEETGLPTATTGCNTWTHERIMGFVIEHTWDTPGFAQREDHPVVCVSWEEATAYADWLAEKTGKPYRLLSSTEFEFAARAGARGPWFWGNANRDACTYANVSDDTWRRLYNYSPVFNCDDGWERTAPVGTFAPNPNGLFDMLGNAWEWTDDCYHADMAGVPTDGSAWGAEDGGQCDARTPRGGSYASGTDWTRLAAQSRDPAGYHSQLLGFRVGLTVDDHNYLR